MMTKDKREELAKKVTAILKREWGEEFRDSDVTGIYDFCMDEADSDDPRTVAMLYEMKYG